jgi:hypothetical protein
MALRVTPSISASGHDVPTKLIKTSNIVGSLESALEELLSFVIRKKSGSDDHLADQLAKEIGEASLSAATLRQQISIILSDVQLTQNAFLLSGMHSLVSWLFFVFNLTNKLNR